MMETFSTARLQARRIGAHHLAYVILMDTDPVVQRTIYRTISTRAESEARLERWLQEERETNMGFWIFSLHGEDIGHGGLFRSSRILGEVELGYALRPPFWGKGYATEMARALIDTVARPLGLQRLVALTYPGNVESQHVLEKCGFTPDGAHVAADGSESPRYRLDLP